MAVLIEAISVIIRREAIQSRYPGKWQAFVQESPNNTLCSDGEIARIGFAKEENVRSFIQQLERCGLIFLDGKRQDIAVVDQSLNTASPVQWLEYGKVKMEGNTISACWVKGSTSKQVVVPKNWRFDSSSTQPDSGPSDDKTYFSTAIMEALKTPMTVGYKNAQNTHTNWRLETEFLPLAAAIAENEGKNIGFSHFTVGLILRLLSRPAEAEHHLRRANELQPSILNTLQELVRCLGEQSRDQEALVFAREAVVVAPQDAGAWGNLAVALAHCGQREEARRALDKAVSLDPKDSSIRDISENFADYFCNANQLKAE